MARNRQRARERKQNLPREDVPGPIDDASDEAAVVEPDDEEPLAVPVAPPADLGAGAGDLATRPSAKVSERSGNRVFNFLGACWAELQRVQWPDRRQVAQATAVVLGFCVMAGAYLGAADYLAKRLVDFLI
jgi:preprotein translocase SecE subunit